MQKFLTAIAALALAGAMAFGFAACADGDTPAGGNNQEQTGGNTTGGQSTNRKLTEAEWKAAWEELDTYDNYTVITDEYSISEDGTKQKLGHAVEERDGNIIMQISDSAMYCGCMVLKGEDVICYYGDGEHWSIYPLEEYMKESMKLSFNYNFGFSINPFCAEINGEEISGTIDKLYSAFAYDESTNSYTATLIVYSIDAGTGQAIKDDFVIDEMTVYFESGKIAKITEKIPGTGTTVDTANDYAERVTTFGGVELEEPTVNS